MNVVGVARIGFERAFNVLARQAKLADLHLGESVLAKEPPVVAIVRCDMGCIGKLLCFASFAAAKSNEAEDAGAGLRDHDVAGIFHNMGADCFVTAGSVAIDEPAKSFGVVDFAFAFDLLRFGHPEWQPLRRVDPPSECDTARFPHAPLPDSDRLRRPGETLLPTPALPERNLSTPSISRAVWFQS